MQHSVSVKEVLRLALPTGARLLAGKPETRITWVRRTRVHPPAFLNLEPGEMVLLSTETLRLVDERLTLHRVVESLAKVAVAAIGVQGLVDRDAIDRAEALGLPLLALPEGVSLLEVERGITRLLIDREAQLARRAQEVSEQLAALAAENRGLDAILTAVTRTTGKVVAVHDVAGLPLAHTAKARVAALAVPEVNAVLNHSNNGAVGAVLGNVYVVPLMVEGRRAGYMTIVNGGKFDELDRLAAERGAMVCAMELAKQKAVVDAETRAHGDWMRRWLVGDPQDDILLESSAQQAGVDLAQTYMAALYRVEAGSDAHVVEMLRSELRSRHIEGVSGQAPDGVLLLYPVDDVHRVTHVAEAVRHTLAMRLRRGVACGLAQPARGLSDLRKGYRQAERALQMGAALNADGAGATMYFGDLNLYRLLLSVDDPQALQTFCDEVLGAVLDYDVRHDGELTRTLEAFFAHNGNLARTAEALCVHRNTLSYRLGRVSEITGMDLDDADTRLMLHLALKVWHVVSASG